MTYIGVDLGRAGGDTTAVAITTMQDGTMKILHSWQLFMRDVTNKAITRFWARYELRRFKNLSHRRKVRERPYFKQPLTITMDQMP